MAEHNGQQPFSRFLVVFIAYTAPDEWITASRLAARIARMPTSDFSKEVSRKLSNLNRFGHLERRLRPDRQHEYRLCKPCRMPPELASLFHFGNSLPSGARRDPLDSCI